MRVFKDLKLVEQLGTCVIRILKSYSEDVYEFSDIVKSPKVVESVNNDVVFSNIINDNNIILNNTQKQILELIRNNNDITQEEIKIELYIGMRTVARNIKVLKDKNIIKRAGSHLFLLYT